MSKSTLSITIPPAGPKFPLVPNPPRIVEVPCRLPEAFNFNLSGKTFTAGIRGGLEFPVVEYVECDGDVQPTGLEEVNACAIARSILGLSAGALGLTTSSGHPTVDFVGSPLQSIALAYEAECAAYEALVKAHAALPRVLHGLLLSLPAPDSEVATGIYSRSAQMLAKYVEYVFEQACAAQTERAEQAAKVVPFPSQVAP